MGSGTAWSDADKHQLRRLVASGIGLSAVADAMGRSPGGIASAAKRYGAVWPKEPMAQRPDDFAEQWAKMGLRQLAAHYGIGESIVARFARELGLKRPSSVHVTRKPKVENPKPIKRGVTEFMGGPRSTILAEQPIRDMSAEGRAADFLRRYGPVFRRDGAWMRGTTRLTGAELIQRATAKGWIL